MDYTPEEKLQQMTVNEILKEKKEAMIRVEELIDELDRRNEEAYNMKFGI